MSGLPPRSKLSHHGRELLGAIRLTADDEVVNMFKMLSGVAKRGRDPTAERQEEEALFDVGISRSPHSRRAAGLLAS